MSSITSCAVKSLTTVYFTAIFVLRLQIHQDLREDLAKAKNLAGIVEVNRQLKQRCQVQTSQTERPRFVYGILYFPDGSIEVLSRKQGFENVHGHDTYRITLTLFRKRVNAWIAALIYLLICNRRR